MAEKSYNCDLAQGFNFKKDLQTTVGHIYALKIGETKLAADFTNIVDPEDVSKTVKVVGIISGISWNIGQAEPVSIAFNVSNANKVSLKDLTENKLSKTNVEIEFKIFEFDQADGQKKYYPAFHTNGASVKALLKKSGGDLELAIQGDQDFTVQQPSNYCAYMAITPEAMDQTLHTANSVTAKAATVWGVKQG